MSATTQHSTNATPIDKPALFKPFEWVAKRDQADTGRYAMLSTIRDLASGLSLTLGLIERSQLEIESEGTPIIDSDGVSRLTRMSIATLNVIEGLIDDHFDEMQDYGSVQRLIAKDGAK